MKATLDSIDDGVIATDDDGCVSFVNALAEQMLGVTRVDVFGHKLGDVFCVEPSFDIASDARVILTKRDGSTTIVEHSIGPVIDANGDPRGTVVTFRDVSERLHRDEDRALSARLATVATIAAGISHELNNPVAAIEANLGFAQREIAGLGAKAARIAPLLADAADALTDAGAAVERVKSVVHQLKIFLFAEAGPTHVDVADALQLSMRLLEGQLKGLLRSAIDPGLIVLGDEGQLVQCFMNVLQNAAQAKPRVVEVRAKAEAPWVVIEIVDDGEGIAVRDLGRIFEPFFTTRAPGAGVGLGLSIARAIALRAGGRISASSEPMKGTTLRIELPLR